MTLIPLNTGRLNYKSGKTVANFYKLSIFKILLELKLLNIVIPMAGVGSRFLNAGFKDPKPLIKIHDVPMIKLIIENLKPKQQHRFIFVCQKEHVVRYELYEKLSLWAPNSILVQIDGITEGAACTVLKAEKYINNNDQLMIANSDQFVNISIDDYLTEMNKRNLDGLIMTMKAHDPKWSFVGLDNEDLVTTVVEKKVISDDATVGIYNFKKGSNFVSSAKLMIAENMRVNGEFYVAPVYNQLIEKKMKIGIFNIGIEGDGMHGLGIPADLEIFLKLPLSKKATNKIL